MGLYTVRTEDVFLGADPADPRGQIELGEDEFIADSEFRGSQRVVFAIATPIEVEHTCGYDGCSRTVDELSERCWQHEGVDE